MALFKRLRSIGSFANLNLQKDSNGIHSEDEFRSIIERERARADRTDHQFSLIILDLGSFDGNHHTTHHMLQKILRRVRRIDDLAGITKILLVSFCLTLLHKGPKNSLKACATHLARQ